MLQEDALSLTVPRQRRRRRRKIEIEAERAAKRRNLMEMVAQLRESHASAESQSQAIDLTKVHTQTYSIALSLVHCFDSFKKNYQFFNIQITSSLCICCSGYSPSPQGLFLIGRLP